MLITEYTCCTFPCSLSIHVPEVGGDGHVVIPGAVMKLKNIFTSPIIESTQLAELVLVAAALQ